MSYKHGMEKAVHNETRAHVGEYFVLCLGDSMGITIHDGYALATRKRWLHAFQAQAYAGTIAKGRRAVVVQVVGTIQDDTNLLHMGVTGVRSYWCGVSKTTNQPYVNDVNAGWEKVKCGGCLDRKGKGPIRQSFP